MLRKIAILLLLLALIGLVYTIFTGRFNTPSHPSNDSGSEIVIYWGEGCPHCENVRDYINKNQLSEKISISQKEVYYNRQNQQDLTNTAKLCPEIDTSQGIGVPFAWIPAEKKCLLGDQPIIEWLTTKALKTQ